MKVWGGEIGSSLDSNMVALTDPANGGLEIRKAKVDARATGGKGSYQEPLPPRVVRTNAERRAAMEFETAETVSSQQGEVPASEPPAMSEGDESEEDDLSVAGGRKRALLIKPGKLAGVMKQTQRKKGKRKRLHYITFTFIHLADAFIQSDFQERALQKCIGH